MLTAAAVFYWPSEWPVCPTNSAKAMKEGRRRTCTDILWI